MCVCVCVSVCVCVRVCVCACRVCVTHSIQLIPSPSISSFFIFYIALVPEFVNDTIIGDPLFTIPLSDVPAVEFPELQGVSLCMEFHGLADKYYNLVSDNCTNVNAHYAPGVANPDLHIIDEIGVKAEGSGGACHEVRVQLAGCRTFVDGTELIGMYRSDGVMVFAMPSRNRTRITVPNCSTNKELVMWVTCERIGREPNLDDTLHLTLSRALGLEPTSHGLVGEWVWLGKRGCVHSGCGHVTVCSP